MTEYFTSILLWQRYFRSNDWPELDWESGYRLTANEKAAVADSLRQFQLGESSEGRGFVAAAQKVDPALGDAVQLFIGEEQRHSRMLGRFMEREGIELVRKHWVDSMFRRIRSLAGLSLYSTVLVTAEFIAVPYYRALRDATKSPLLKAICERILEDEFRHLEFQALLLGVKRWRVLESIHPWFLDLTCLIVWKEHRRVFRVAGYSFARFRDEAQGALRYCRGKRIMEECVLAGSSFSR